MDGRGEYLPAFTLLADTQLGGEPESRPAVSNRSGGSSAWGRVPLATREALEESLEPCHPFAKVGLTNLQTFDTPFKARAHA